MDRAGIASRQMEELEQQLGALRRRIAEEGGASSIAGAAVEGLQGALEALRVAEKKLLAQSGELELAAREIGLQRERYEQLFDAAPDAYLVTDELAVIQEANAAAGRLLGVKPARLAGKPFSVFVAGLPRRAFGDELARRLDSPGEEWEIALHARDGTEIPAACTIVRAPRRPGDRGARLLWSIRDITDRREAAVRRVELEREKARAEAVESARVQLDAIVRHLPVALMIAEAPGGRLITYNTAAEELFGYPPPLPEGVDEYSELYRGFRPDGQPVEPDEWPLARAVQHGVEVIGEEVEMECLDGRRIVVRISAAPVRDEEGRVVAGVAGMFDVTGARRQAAAQRFLGEVSDALSASLDYRAIVQRLAELCVGELADYAAVYGVEPDGELRGLGFAVADPADRAGLELLRAGIPRDAGAEHPAIQVLRTGEPKLIPRVSEPRLLEVAGGVERRSRLRAIEIDSGLVVPLVAGGRTLGVIALARNASSDPFTRDDLALTQEIASRAAHAVDNARLYLEAQRTAQMKEETISVVSHDLRNALNAALTNADLLLDITPAFVDGSRSRRQMEAMRRSLDHMHRLVQDLLEVDRLDRGRLAVHPDRVPLGALVEEINGLLGPIARDSGLHSEVVGPERDIVIRVDYARLVQVLSNLIGNAVKATPPGGRISVRMEEAPGEIRFHVSDTGEGIEEEHLPRIFDRFFQAPTRGKSGSGLGLTISRGIVEAHGGRMWADSRLGEGSTFSFAIPHAEEGEPRD